MNTQQPEQYGGEVTVYCSYSCPQCNSDCYYYAQAHLTSQCMCQRSHN